MSRASKLEACPYCGGSVRHAGRTTEVTANGHHNNVYECGECGKEIVSG